MLFAEGVDWVSILSDKGLAVAIVVAGMFALWKAITFTAPLAKDFVESTVELNSSLKETSIKQTDLMKNHSIELTAIRESLTNKSHCPMFGTDLHELTTKSQREARELLARQSHSSQRKESEP